MLRLDGFSFQRAEAARAKALMLQRLAQHVGDTGVVRRLKPDCPDPACQVFERPRRHVPAGRRRLAWDPPVSTSVGSAG
eukprot:1537552-Amphidinium_carterae.1